MKYHIITYGCQMNKSDTERISSVLNEAGFVISKKEEDADIIVVNACSVRQSAIDRIHGKVHNWKKRDKELITVLTGCVLAQDKKRFEKEFDIVLDRSEIGELANKISGKALKNISINNPIEYLNINPKYSEKFRAFVPIMSGCDNFCTYCAVPYTRGREKSRKVKSVLDEIKSLVEKGRIEITLLGQNVNTYRPNDINEFGQENPYKDNFAKLLWEINQIKGIERIHFTAPHPKDMSDEVINALTLLKHINYLHLPVQSGDNEILKRMNRNYSREDYIKLIEKIRDKKPDIAIGTDIIVGFPGESEEAFMNTVDLYKKCDFDISYTAQYSPRSGTLAYKIKDDVLKSEKKRRWRYLEDLMIQITLKKNQKLVNKNVSVLVDRYEDGYCFGQSKEMKLVRFEGKEDLIGKIVEVKIKEAKEWILYG